MRFTLYIRVYGKRFKAMMCLNKSDRIADIISDYDKLLQFSRIVRFNHILSRCFNDNSIFDEMILNESDVLEIIDKSESFKNHAITVKLPKDFGVKKADFKIEISSTNHGSMSSKITYDGVQITDQEFKELTSNHRRLVFMRGQWIDADCDWLEQFNNKSLTVNELLNLSDGLEDKLVFNDNIEDFKFKFKNKKIFKEHQIEAIRKISSAFKSNRNILLADDMGLGKTITTIGLIDGFLNPDKKPVLIVVPKSLVGNWISEFNKFASDVNVKILESGIPRFKNTVYVSTYGNILHHSNLIHNTEWSIVILDEAQQIKNYNTKISKIICNCNTEHRLAMTGTPIENSVRDLWSIFRFINPMILGDMKTFEKSVNCNNYERLIKCLSPYIIRRLKSDISNLNLPKKEEIKVSVELSSQEIALYNSLICNYHKEHIISNSTILKYLNSLKIVCGMPSNLFDVDFVPSKLLKVGEIIRNSNYDKFVIFTQYVDTADKIANYLESSIYKRKGVIINGKLSSKSRTEIAKEFQQGKYPFIVLTLKSGNCGITLTESCNLIHYDRWWNPAVENQATDRIYRIGQQHDVKIYKMIAKDSIETRIDEILDNKNFLFDNIINAFKNKNSLKRI